MNNPKNDAHTHIKDMTLTITNG